jgi:hypothetical protein
MSAADGRPDNLDAPLPQMAGHTRESSVYTRAALHPRAAVLATAGLAIGVGAFAARKR